MRSVLQVRNKRLIIMPGISGMQYAHRVLLQKISYFYTLLQAILEAAMMLEYVPRNTSRRPASISGRSYIRCYGKTLIIGYGAYPLSAYLLKTYPFKNALREEKIFNKKLSGARVVVERVFGILKAR